MSAPSTSPRPIPRPDDLDTTGGGLDPSADSGDSDQDPLDADVTNKDLLALGVDWELIEGNASDFITGLFEEQNGSAALRGFGKVLNGVGSYANAVDQIRTVDELFDIAVDDDFDSLGTSVSITFNTQVANEKAVSTVLSVGTLGATDVMTVGEQSASEFAGEYVNDQIERAGGSIGSAAAAYQDNMIDNYLNSLTRMKPVVLDLDNDGIEFTSGIASKFDVDGDGFVENTAWAAPDDGFLVIDLNADGTRGPGDGKIDQARELSFSLWAEHGATDMQALAEAVDDNGNLIFDTNGDGRLDANDEVWSELRVWRDVNLNGETNAGELQTLANLQIADINLRYDDGSFYAETSDDRSIFGNTVHGQASFTMAGEVIIGGAADISLAYKDDGQKIVENANGFQIFRERGDVWTYITQSDDDPSDLDLNAIGIQGIYGNSKNNRFDATAATYSVILDGGFGNDELIGGDANDVLMGKDGNDVMRGGLGDDIYVFSRGGGTDVIDESSFTVREGGVNTVKFDDQGLSSQYNPGSGKAIVGENLWVHDTKSNVSVTSRDGGMDAIEFGPDIGIADLIITNENRYPEQGTFQPSFDRKKDYDLFINFVDETGTEDGKDQLTIKNAGDDNFLIEEFRFNDGYALNFIADFFTFTPKLLIEGTTGDDTDNSITVGGGWVTGMAGNDKILGADDLVEFINGGAGDDTLTGGSLEIENKHQRSDYFIFNEDDGNDIITDFEVGVDIIIFDVEGLEFDAITIEDAAGDAVIRYDDDDSITLSGISANQLGEFSFDFA